MAFNKVGFIGLGLIGGSIAMNFRRHYPYTKIIAISSHEETIEKAFDMGVIENESFIPIKDFSDCDYIFLCAPTSLNIDYLSELKDIISEKTIITDVGSTKTEIHKEVKRLGLDSHFLGGHPMTGSEKTGIENADVNLLEQTFYVLTPTETTPKQAVRDMTEFVKQCGAIPLHLDYEKHDYSRASISHLPHMIAYSLVNLVNDIDDENQTMKTMAAGGFRDVTRIGAASPIMWENIAVTNRAPLLDLMDKYIDEFSRLRELIEKSDERGMMDYFQKSKDYRDSFEIPSKRKLTEVFEMYVDILDRPGGIAMIASTLAFAGINIKNVGIINNREYEQGVMRIEFYDRESLAKAYNELEERNYTIYLR